MSDFAICNNIATEPLKEMDRIWHAWDQLGVSDGVVEEKSIEEEFRQVLFSVTYVVLLIHFYLIDQKNVSVLGAMN